MQNTTFNDIHNKQRISKVNNKSTKKYCNNMSKVKQNIKMTQQTLLWYTCCQIWTSPTPNAILLVFILNRHLYVELDFNKFLKMLGQKMVYIKCKSKKIPEVDSALRNRS